MTQNIVEKFLSNFQNGISLPTHYRVEFQLPRGVSLGAGEIGVNDDSRAGQIQKWQSNFNAKGGIDVKCHTCNLPQRNLMTSEFRQNSAPFRLPFSATYDPVTFSFYADGNLDTRDYFEIWQGAVANFGTNTMNFPDEYFSDVKIYLMNSAGQDTYGIELYEAWPLSVGAVDLSYSNVNVPQSVTVTLSYRNWKSIYDPQTFNKSV